MEPNKHTAALTPAERRIAEHVVARFEAALQAEQAWLAEFVADLTAALCTAYGSEPLRAALQTRVELLTDSTPSTSSRRTLVHAALAAASHPRAPRSL